jgi:hypothetical protein
VSARSPSPVVPPLPSPAASLPTHPLFAGNLFAASNRARIAAARSLTWSLWNAQLISMRRDWRYSRVTSCWCVSFAGASTKFSTTSRNTRIIVCSPHLFAPGPQRQPPPAGLAARRGRCGSARGTTQVRTAHMLEPQGMACLKIVLPVERAARSARALAHAPAGRPFASPNAVLRLFQIKLGRGSQACRSLPPYTCLSPLLPVRVPPR